MTERLQWSEAGGGETPGVGAALPARLRAARQVLARVGMEAPVASLDRLLERLAGERFHLAVLGQFKRGKSTLLNALLGVDLLPTAVVPLTALPTLIEFGPGWQVHVEALGAPRDREVAGPDAARALLEQWVTERSNPENRLGVKWVRVRAPLPLLAAGVVLIDTPGVGSTLAHNTETTHAFLSQCDAALFVVSADPPLTAEEASFLRVVRGQVERIFFVLNKVDYLDPAERGEAVRFLEQTLEATCGMESPGPIFCVSARKGLAARLAEDADGYQASGLAEVERRLERFFAGERLAVLRAAVWTKARAQVEQALLELRIRRRALSMPVAELEATLGLFERKLSELGEQRLTAQDRLQGDERRAVADLEEETRELRRRAHHALGSLLAEQLRRIDAGEGSAADLPARIEEAVPALFGREMTAIAERTAARVEGVLAVHRREADELIGAIRQAAAELFHVPYRAPEPGEAFRVEVRLFWETRKWTPSYSPIPEGALDRLLPPGRRRARFERRWRRQVDALVTQNTETARWEVLQGLKKAFWSYRRQLDERLEQTLEATHGAIGSALQRREAEADRVADALTRVEEAVSWLERWLEERSPDGRAAGPEGEPLARTAHP